RPRWARWPRPRVNVLGCGGGSERRAFMSHGESAAAGTRDDQPPRQPDDAFTADPSARQALAGDPVGEADAEPGELSAEPDDPGAVGGPAAGPGWSDGPHRGEGEHTELTVADLEQEGEIAADYVEGLLDIADLDGDIDMDVEGDRALVSVVGGTLDELVGTTGAVLEALQELTRL